MLNNYLEKYNLFKIIQEHLFNESSFSSKVTNIAINFQEIILNRDNWNLFLNGECFIIKNENYYFFHEERLFALVFKEQKANDNEIFYEIEFDVFKKTNFFKDNDESFQKFLDIYENFMYFSASIAIKHKDSNVFWNKLIICIKNFKQTPDKSIFAFTGSDGGTKTSLQSRTKKESMNYIFSFIKSAFMIKLKNKFAPDAEIILKSYLSYINKLKQELEIQNNKFDELKELIKNTIKKLKQYLLELNNNEDLNLYKNNIEDIINNLKEIEIDSNDLEQYKIFLKNLDNIIFKIKNAFNKIEKIEEKYPNLEYIEYQANGIKDILNDFKQKRSYYSYGATLAILKIISEVKKIKKQKVLVIGFQRKIERIFINLIKKYKLSENDIFYAKIFLDKSTAFYDNIVHLGIINKEEFLTLLDASIKQVLKNQDLIILSKDYIQKFEKLKTLLSDDIFIKQKTFANYISSLNFDIFIEDDPTINLFYLLDLTPEGLYTSLNTREKLYYDKLISLNISPENIKLKRKGNNYNYLTFKI